MSESSNKHNGNPIGIDQNDTGGLPYSYHLSYIVNKAIRGFWERRGMSEPCCDLKIVYGKYGGGKKHDRRKGE